MQTEIERLLKIIEQKLDWGQSAAWQSKDFESLNQRIFDETGVSLSSSTLRRVWGRVEYRHLPSTTTLDTLAKFAGYETWRSFTRLENKSSAATAVEDAPKPINALHKTYWFKIAVAATGIVAAVFVVIFAFKKAPVKIAAKAYSFSSKPVTRSIPNSVIFTYDATSSSDDSVYIQQSWDPRTKTLVDRGLHTQTSIYYEPGFYHAKLIVGGEVVKEHPLLIPTNGWLGLIESKPVPVYLQANKFIHKDSLGLPFEAVNQSNQQQGMAPPVVKYYNVGNFTPIALEDFSFSAEVKNEYREGAGACQFTSIGLITDESPIFIPLSSAGCVSEISLMNAGQIVSGKKADLSGFGVDFGNWVQVSCKGMGGKIQYFVGGKLAYQAAIPQKGVKIVGIGFMFQGAGAVKKIVLTGNNAKALQAF